jgi:hypothetical protein
LRLNPKGTLLLANCQDRVLRMMEVLAPPPSSSQPSLSRDEAASLLQATNLKVSRVLLSTGR